MKEHRCIDTEVMSRWVKNVETMISNEVAELHYHEQPEWLEVLEGSMTFSSAGGEEYLLSEGVCFHILPGEVHKVKAAQDGVKYQMWTPRSPTSDFRQEVNPPLGLSELINDNLGIPTAEDKADIPFLQRVMDASLVFRKADGTIVDITGYLQGLPGPNRRKASDNIRLLHVNDRSVVLETFVYTVNSSGERSGSYRNTRIFIRGTDSWRCRMWLNYPDDTFNGG